jgi:hypothetical protein
VAVSGSFQKALAASAAEHRSGVEKAASTLGASIHSAATSAATIMSACWLAGKAIDQFQRR